ncbi:DUF6086 family protein [Streptomyces sp. NBC_01476]|uniref:DUF6086 family protein n=1 Tax=Streptomyces sp. NBC_01476 TaxID=2903881 RepID=UPI002E2F7C3A|nr:DUF6086 family protein [Streptomyces sp. NBC_01476]
MSADGISVSGRSSAPRPGTTSYVRFRTGSSHYAAGAGAGAGASAGVAVTVGLWRPDGRVAGLFLGHAELFADLLGVPSGIGDVINDECSVDDSVLEAFCAASLAEYGATDQGIQRTLTVGFIATALVLLDRAGRPVPTTVATEQRAAWAALRDQHAAVMPR